MGVLLWAIHALSLSTFRAPDVDATGAYTDVVFGLFWLLGYRFCPRIADIGGARHWRIDSSVDYGLLNGIASHRINIASTPSSLKKTDDLLRLAGSLKLGMVQGGTGKQHEKCAAHKSTRVAIGSWHIEPIGESCYGWVPNARPALQQQLHRRQCPRPHRRAGSPQWMRFCGYTRPALLLCSCRFPFRRS